MIDRPESPTAISPERMASGQQRQGRRAINVRTAVTFIVFLAIVAGIAIAIGVYVHGLVGH